MPDDAPTPDDIARQMDLFNLDPGDEHDPTRAYDTLICDIEDMGWCATYEGGAVHVKGNHRDQECWAILWIDQDRMIMADFGSQSLPLCGIDNYEICIPMLEKFLEDPWAWRAAQSAAQS